MNLEPKKDYTVIHVFEDGESSIRLKSGLEVASMLEKLSLEYPNPLEMFPEIQEEKTFYFSTLGGKIIIIKGVPVIPKSVQVVTKLSIN
jgi:hypothetical protein